MSSNYKFTDEQLNRINKLKNPSLMIIIHLSKELGLDPRVVTYYLINKELKESENK